MEEKKNNFTRPLSFDSSKERSNEQVDKQLLYLKVKVGDWDQSFTASAIRDLKVPEFGQRFDIPTRPCLWWHRFRNYPPDARAFPEMKPRMGVLFVLIKFLIPTIKALEFKSREEK